MPQKLAGKVAVVTGGNSGICLQRRSASSTKAAKKVLQGRYAGKAGPIELSVD